MDRRIYLELLSASFYGLTYLTSLYFVCYKYSTKIIPKNFRLNTSRKLFIYSMLTISIALPLVNAIIWKISNYFETRSPWYEQSHGFILNIIIWFFLGSLIALISFFALLKPRLVHATSAINVIAAFLTHVGYTFFIIFVYMIFLSLFGIEHSNID
jgi:hypothetical protein